MKTDCLYWLYYRNAGRRVDICDNIIIDFQIGIIKGEMDSCS
jgi:hypothetical protein